MTRHIQQAMTLASPRSHLGAPRAIALSSTSTSTSTTPLECGGTAMHCTHGRRRIDALAPSAADGVAYGLLTMPHVGRAACLLCRW